MNDTDSPKAEDSTADAEAATVDAHHLRLLEAILFSAVEPLTEAEIAERLPDGAPVPALLAALTDAYANRGITLVAAGGRWFFHTADDLGEELRVHMKVPRRLSRAAMETLAIVAYHQPVTRAEIEEIRGVGLSRGTLDALLEARWIGPRGRRRTAGRPVTWGTTAGFLQTFGLAAIDDLPGLDDLRAAGLLDKRPAIQITDIQDDETEESEEDEPLADDEELLDMDLPDDDIAVEEGPDADPEQRS
ncbi:MAG: SMC-Scp complex subunit ScpB [Alphaproteobacteria bacterium]